MEEHRKGGPSQIDEGQFEDLSGRSAIFVEEIDEEEEPYVPVEIPSGQVVINAANHAIQEVLRIKDQLQGGKEAGKQQNPSQPIAKEQHVPPIEEVKIEPQIKAIQEEQKPEPVPVVQEPFQLEPQKKEGPLQQIQEAVADAPAQIEVAVDIPQHEEVKQEPVLVEPTKELIPIANLPMDQSLPVANEKILAITEAQQVEIAPSVEAQTKATDTDVPIIQVKLPPNQQQDIQHKEPVVEVQTLNAPETREVAPQNPQKLAEEQEGKVNVQPTPTRPINLKLFPKKLEVPQSVIPIPSSPEPTQQPITQPTPSPPIQVAYMKEDIPPTPPPLIGPKLEEPFGQESSLFQSSVINFVAPPSVSKPQPVLVPPQRQEVVDNRKDEEEELKQQRIRQEDAERRRRELQDRLRKLQQIRSASEIILKIKVATGKKEYKRALDLINNDLPAAYQQQFSIAHIKAKLLHQLNRNTQSLELYNMLSKTQSPDSEINFEKACVELTLNDRNSAERSMAGVKLTTAKRIILLGDIEYKRSSVSDIAQKHYSKAHNIEPSAITANRFATVLLNRNEPKAAYPFLEFACQKNTFCGQYLNDKACAEILMGKFSDAQRSMISATSCQDATWKFANNQAICRYLNGKGNDAKSVLEQAVRDSNGSNESVVLNLARVVEDVGGQMKAIEIYQKYLQNFRGSLKYWLGYCATVLRTKDSKLMAKVYHEYFQIFNLNLQNQAAQLMFCKFHAATESESVQNTEYCRKFLKKLLDATNDSKMKADIYNISAYMYRNIKDYTEASAQLRVGSGQWPNNLTIRWNLAYSLYKDKKFLNSMTSLEMLHKQPLSEKMLKMVAYLTILVHFQLGQKTEAARYIKTLMNTQYIQDLQYFQALEAKVNGTIRK